MSSTRRSRSMRLGPPVRTVGMCRSGWNESWEFSDDPSRLAFCTDKLAFILATPSAISLYLLSRCRRRGLTPKSFLNACRSALQWQTRLLRRYFRAATGHWFPRSVIYRKIARHPVKHLRSQPTDLVTAKSPLLGKAAQQHQTRNDELWAARQACDVVSAQEFLEGRQRFIDPRREDYFGARPS
jgi:hypothetical protein